MKTATPATAAYKAVFWRLVDEGWRLTDYGHGWRNFARTRPDNPMVDDRLSVNAAGSKVVHGDPTPSSRYYAETLPCEATLAHWAATYLDR